jgi:hypothetical protein
LDYDDEDRTSPVLVDRGVDTTPTQDRRAA